MAKAVLRRKFTAIQGYLRKQTNKTSNKQSNLTLKEPEKEQTTPKRSRRKKIIKIRVEIN